MQVTTEGEQLLCRREDDNIHDLFSVAMIKNNYTVGHVPKKISTTCSLFLRRGGSIKCTVTGSKRYSQDLLLPVCSLQLLLHLADGGIIAERSPFGSGSFLTRTHTHTYTRTPKHCNIVFMNVLIAGCY